jgi:BlaI family transcriptional regulator, penicillinase repressor
MPKQRAPVPSPTDAELEILRVLWRDGERTVREVHAEVSRDKPVAYTTILKQMQVMQQKGILMRSERFRSHVYWPAQPQTQVQKRLSQDLLHQAFGGSARQLLQSALGGRRVDAAEIREIRELLQRLEKESKS